MRLFAGDRIYKILDRLGGVDEEGNEEPIEAGMLSKQIEKAQRKVEEQNFLIRKRVLEYDDVMNEQRRVIYAYRDEVLEGQEHRRGGAPAGRRSDRAHDRPVHARRLHGGLGSRRAVHALGQFFPLDIGDEDLDPETVDRVVADRPHHRAWRSSATTRASRRSARS